MTTGAEIGSRLRAWLRQSEAAAPPPRRLEAFLLDHLGDDSRLRGPLRDLALQPLLLQLLRERSPAVRRSLLDALVRDLADTYAAPVLAELLDLLEAATDLAPQRPAGPGPILTTTTTTPAPGITAAGAADPATVPAVPTPTPAATTARAAIATATTTTATTTTAAITTVGTGPLHRQHLNALARSLHPLAPGLALGFLSAPVLAWLVGELSRLLPADWSGALLLVLLLCGMQLLLVVLPCLRPGASLRLVGSGNPRRSWRWISAAWVHHRHGEALLHAALLLVLLGGSPLPLSELVLRYQLTHLATLAPAVLLARRWLRGGLWDGASGAVAALISLAAGVSLLGWRSIDFPLLVFRVPSWVLFVVYGAIQMAWVLPRRSRQDRSLPLQRLLCSCWWWGSVFGLLWALISRLREWVTPLAQALFAPA